MTLSEKKALIEAFLVRCNAYADEQLARYRAALDEATGSKALELTDKIGHWTAYRTFNEHAIGELATSALDDWFD